MRSMPSGKRGRSDDISSLRRTFDTYVAKALTPSEKLVASKARSMGSSALLWYDKLLARRKGATQSGLDTCACPSQRDPLRRISKAQQAAAGQPWEGGRAGSSSPAASGLPSKLHYGSYSPPGQSRTPTNRSPRVKSPSPADSDGSCGPAFSRGRSPMRWQTPQPQATRKDIAAELPDMHKGKLQTPQYSPAMRPSVRVCSLLDEHLRNASGGEVGGSGDWDSDSGANVGPSVREALRLQLNSATRARSKKGIPSSRPSPSRPAGKHTPYSNSPPQGHAQHSHAAAGLPEELTALSLQLESERNQFVAAVNAAISELRPPATVPESPSAGKMGKKKLKTRRKTKKKAVSSSGLGTFSLQARKLKAADCGLGPGSATVYSPACCMYGS